MPALLATRLPSLPPPQKGKVREIYDLGDCLLIVATDRISAFDVIMANGIPDKGRVLNLLSSFWFEKLAGTVRHHCITVSDEVIAKRLGSKHPELNGRSMLARKAKPLPIECVARGYLAGSLWKEYLHEGRHVHGFDLPEGLLECARLPEPIFTPATKAEEGHDENLSLKAAADLVGNGVLQEVQRLTLELYGAAHAYALTRGIILADTKFEFGIDEDGLIWIDEALTPDSSRFWDMNLYQPGHSQPSFDKQFVRDWLEASGWDKTPPGPELPETIVEQTRDRYLDAFERLTGHPLPL